MAFKNTMKSARPTSVKSGPAKPIKIDANFGGREVGGPSATSPSSQFHTFSGSVHGFKSSYDGDHGHPVEGAKYTSHGVSTQWVRDRVKSAAANPKVSSERLGAFVAKSASMSDNRASDSPRSGSVRSKRDAAYEAGSRGAHVRATGERKPAQGMSPKLDSKAASGWDRWRAAHAEDRKGTGARGMGRLSLNADAKKIVREKQRGTW